MAGHASSELVRYDPTVNGHEPELSDPIPGWRRPIALVGWGTLIAILIALIVWGIIQLAQGAPPQEGAPIVISTPPTSTLSPPSSVSPVVPPSGQQTYQESAPTITTEIPTPSSANPDTPTMSATPSPGSFPLPPLPSVITLPALPGLPTEITLPPGL
jgi:hypothetical protein